jgi:hypothetical protein
MSVLGLHDHKATEGFRLLRLRQAIALPIYTVSLILDFASAALGPSRCVDRRRRLAIGACQKRVTASKPFP